MGMLNTFRSTVQFRRFSLDPVEWRLRKMVSIEECRKIAKRRLPHGVFDYIDGAAEDERTAGRNVSAFSRIEFKPRVLRDVSTLDTSTTIFGRPASMPLILAPTGYTRIADSQGELAVARAAQRAGVPYSLSTMGTRSIEEVAAVSDGREVVPGLHLARPRSRPGARRAGEGVRLHHALADRRHGGARPARTRRPARLHAARRRSGSTRCSTARCIPVGPGTSCATTRSCSPTWSATAIRRTARIRSRSPPTSGSQFDQALSWHDIDWLRTFWDGPIVLKGIQTVADAKQAVAMGVQGIGLSNHGGRQLDDAPSPIELVEPVRQEIADQATIICDGGVRRGSDIVKAIALGADAVSVGSAVPVRARGGRRTWRRPRPRVPARRLRAHDGAHRLSLGRRDRPRSRPLAHRTIHLTDPSPDRPVRRASEAGGRLRRCPIVY